MSLALAKGAYETLIWQHILTNYVKEYLFCKCAYTIARV